MKTATPNASAGRVQAIVVAGDEVTIAPHAGGAPGVILSIRVVQDLVGFSVTFDAAYIGAVEIPQTPHTYSSFQFEIDPGGNAYLCAAPVLGVPLP